MTTRSLSFALLATTLMLPLSGKAPTTLRYKVTQHFAQTIDLSAMGQDVQSQQATFDAYLTVTTQDSAGGHALSVKVDSVIPAADADPMVANTLIGQLKDANGSGFVDGSGEVSGFASGMGGAGLKGLVQVLYPKVRKGVKPGDKWTDTSSVTDSVPGGAVTRNVITNYTATAGDTWNGQATVKLVTASSYTIAGGQSGMSLEGNGSNNGTVTLSKAGHAVSAENSGQVNITATTPQAPAPLPIVNKTASSVVLLP